MPIFHQPEIRWGLFRISGEFGRVRSLEFTQSLGPREKGGWPGRLGGEAFVGVLGGGGGYEGRGSLEKLRVSP